MILVIKHIAIEGPGTLGEFLQANRYDLRIIELSQGEVLPEKFKDVEAVVLLGGPMNVYEEDRFPFLKEENIFIQKVLKQQIPFLGICLGSQLLAKAVGAKVRRAQADEIGFFPVRLNRDGRNDQLFKGVPESFEVFQWHGDTFDIPAGGIWLAEGEKCPRQAFRVGKNAYGLQFHIEINGQTIEQWVQAYFEKNNPKYEILHRKMLNDYMNKKENFNTWATQIYNNFLEVIKNRKEG